MLPKPLVITAKDLRQVLAGGSALFQAVLLGLLLVFIFSLSNGPGERITSQGAAAIFGCLPVFRWSLFSPCFTGWKKKMIPGWLWS